MTRERAIELLHREVNSTIYHDIRELWKIHSMAEDNRDLEELISTLTEDCVYEMPQTGNIWRGHDGAKLFYTELLTAFPDINFDLQEIVIGPQGVWEEAVATGTHEEKWLSHPATGQKIEFTVLIYFPWDPDVRKFRGEKITLDSYQKLSRPG